MDNNKSNLKETETLEDSNIKKNNASQANEDNNEMFELNNNEVETDIDANNKEELSEKDNYYKVQQRERFKDSKYYDMKKQDLEAKLAKAREEKNKNYKPKNLNEKGPIKADGSNTVDKNKFDRLNDRFNVLNAKKNLAMNEATRLKNTANKIVNPVDATKDSAKKVVQKAVQEKKDVIKKAAKKKIKTFILSNPWILIMLGSILIIIIVLLIVASIISQENKYRKYNIECDFNLTNVNLTTCGAETSQLMSLDEYVLSTTYSIASGRDLNEEQTKALMIAIKTNALIKGNYNNIDKSISIDDCDIKELYQNGNFTQYNYDINFTVIPSDGWWWPVGSSSATSGNIYGGTPVDSRSSTYPDGISSYFGPRDAPTSGASTDHGAIDIPVPTGTPVIASNAGVVITACATGGCGTGYGNYIRIDHNNGIITLYAHLDSVVVSNGQNVVKGQLIGYSGSTGISTGPHLHFAVNVNGNAVDPLNYVSFSNARSGASISSDTPVNDLSQRTDELSTWYNDIADYLFVKKAFQGTITNLSSGNTTVLELTEAKMGALKSMDNSDYSNILKTLFNIKDSDNYLYSLADNCDYTMTDSIGYGDNLAYWWPIGSSETTEVDGKTFASGKPENVQINSEYGQRTLEGKEGFHDGVDLAGSLNVTNVIASMDGTVQAVNNSCISGGDQSCGNNGGNYVKILDKFGNTQGYYHLYENSILVKEGDQVKQGQVLAKVGSSGHSTGPHLHFAMKVSNQSVNPLDYISADNPRPVSISDDLQFAGDSKQYRSYACQTFLKSGFSESATVAMLLNLNAESGINPKNLEDSYETKYGYTDDTYTEAVDKGTYSEYSFVNDSAGYGLAQWTYDARKQKLYTYAKNQKASIGNINMQLSFFANELKQYEGVYNYLQGNHSAYDMSVYFCRNYENPATSCEDRASNSVDSFIKYVKNGCS